MRHHHLILSAVFLAACEGDDEGTPPEEEIDCTTSGNACRWLGIPGAGAFTGEGTDITDDPLTGTYLFLPQDLWFAPDGSAYYPDFNNHRIRKVQTDGTVVTVSGTGMLGDGPNDSGSVINCWTGCDADLSAWNHPTHVIGHPDEPTKLYVSAWHNSRLNIIDELAGTMTWYAGTGGRFYGGGLDPLSVTDGTPETKVFKRELAVMDLPSAIAFGDDGTLYFADQANHMIRKIAPGSDRLEVFAGSIVVDADPVTGLPVAGPASIHRQPGFEGDGGVATLAKLHGHTDQKADPGSKLIFDSANNRLILADTVNGVIRAVDIDTNIIDTIAGKYTSAGETTITDAINGETYTADSGSIPGYAGDGGPALEAVFNTPRDIALGIDGELYIADTKNNCVRVLNTDGTVDTFAGICGTTGQPWSGDGLAATEAALWDPFGVEVDAEGNVYIANSSEHIIVKVAY
jgi:sugar lactone lactonase YvrE